MVCLLVLASACSGRAEKAAQYAAEANQLLEAGKIADAREKIGEALAERDDIPEIYLLRGRIEAAAGDYGKSYAAYSNALTLDNTNVEALQAVSQLGLRTGNIRESLDAAERILALQPEDTNALIVRGVHAFLQRRYPDAVEYADRVLVQQAANEEAHILKSRALFMAGKPDEAMKVANLQTGAGETAGVARTKLELFRELRDPMGMQAQFDILRRLAPEDIALRIDEADLQFKRGQSSEGQALIVDVLARDDLPGDVAVRAIAVLDAYAAKFSDGEVVRVARSASEASRAELARKLIADGEAGNAAVLVRSLPASVRQPLAARLAVLRQDPKQAMAFANAVLNSDHTECDALVASAAAEIKSGKTLNSLREAQLAAAECPARPYTWLAVTDAYFARGELEGVERAFRQGIEANPQSLRLAAQFSNWLSKQGRRREAIAVARTFTRKSPALVRGWDMYLELCTQTHEDCKERALRGRDNARTLYGPDGDPNELPPAGLFGRLERR